MSLLMIAGTVGIVLVLLVLDLLMVIASKPADFWVERALVVNAPASVVFPLINDLTQWKNWSPFEKLDPAMKKTFTGPAAGVGASYTWSGNKKAGEGKMTIVNVTPDKLVSMTLEFTRPFKATNQVNFKILNADDRCRVTWQMDGKHNFMGKAFSTFCNMDKLVGKEFEAGLGNLGRLATNT